MFESVHDSYRYRKVAPAVEYIKPNPSKEQISALTGISAVSLNRLFKELYGKTMKSYITEKK